MTWTQTLAVTSAALLVLGVGLLAAAWEWFRRNPDLEAM